MTAVRLATVVALAACGRSSTPAPAERATVPVSPRDAAVIAAVIAIDAAPASIVDESAPATRTFAASTGRSLVGHMRASWPLDIPEMPWVANTFVNMSLDSFDGALLVGTVDEYAAPGLDARACVVEVVWDSNAKKGVQLRGAPVIEKVDDAGMTHATWRFRTRVEGAPTAVKATAFAFCPNDVMFYSIEMIAPGPGIHDAYCKDQRRDPSRNARGTLVGTRTFDLAFACGTLVRQRGRELVDDCRGDTLVSLDAIGAGSGAAAPPAGTDVNDEELRRWYDGGSECARITLVGSPTFPETARRPFAEFLKRAGGRVLDGFSRDGMIQP